MALLELPERLRFDWLRDYGPHWEPGDTAFWLEPSTCDELAAWYAKYRPEETGFKEAAGLRIEIVPALRNANQRRGELLQNSRLQYAIGQYYANSARNKLPGGWY